jgi:hypothetical protein
MNYGARIRRNSPGRMTTRLPNREVIMAASPQA